jgi:hypothetical protein
MDSADGKHYNWTLAFLITVSVLGLFLSILFVFQPFTPDYGFAYRKLVAGTSFSTLCVLGMFVALFPSSCSTLSKSKKFKRKLKTTPTMHETNYQAHHPICENFSTHILIIGNMKFCATCSGLLVGAIFVLLSTVLYFFGDLGMDEPFILVLVGAIGVSSGLIQSAFPKFSNGWIRFCFSIIFVVGAFLMFISLDEAVRNLSVDLFFVALSVLLILTKVALSQRDHQRICSQCSKEYC